MNNILRMFRPFPLLAAAIVTALSVVAPCLRAQDNPAGRPEPAPIPLPASGIFRKDNLAAWCIVPFDKAKRSPEERAAMLERIGVRKFVHDYRSEHVPLFEREILALKKHGIELTGWMFPSSMNAMAESTLALFEKHAVKPQLWIIKGGGSVKADSPEDQLKRVQTEVQSLAPVAKAAATRGLKIGLYNHGGWFGEPENQIEIIKGLKNEGLTNVGIVYNLHHGHGHLKDFETSLKQMLPYLMCLNINGMDVGGDQRGRKILPVAAGSEDGKLIRLIRDSGYAGPIGILNHTGEDAEGRLLDNLDGLAAVVRAVESGATLVQPTFRTWKEPTTPAIPPLPASGIFRKENLAAWCIVPFDSKKRSPEDRAAMVAKMGIRKIAYDWRAEHVAEFEREIVAYQKNGIEMFAFWGLHDDALRLFEKHKIQPQLWVMLRAAGDTDEAKIDAAATALLPTLEKAKKLGCKVGIYNHGGWGGEPENMIAVCEHLKKKHGTENVGIVYNLHHGHSHLARLSTALDAMKPWLLCLNLNGMDPNGDQRGRKILPIAAGTQDVRVTKLIRDSGYTGPIGILNHTGEDAEARLLDNLDGLAAVVQAIEKGGNPNKPLYRSWKEASSSPAQSAPSVPTGTPSLSPAFGKALRGPFFAEGGAAFRALPITVECRAKISGKQGFNILVACDPKSSAEHWELYTYSQSGFLSLYMPGRGGNISTTVNVCDDQWHTLAAVIEPNRARLYVDGKLAKEAPISPLKGNPVAGGIAIGALVERSIRCEGIIDDVRISSGIREPVTPDAPPLKRDAQTLGLWSFDDLADAPKTSAVPEIPRSELPPSKIISAAKPDSLTPTNGWSLKGTGKDWARSLGGGTSNRFSELTQITPDNVSQLKEAWTYHSGGRANVQCNPVVVDGVMYIPTPGRHVVAVDARTGKERWRFQTDALTGETRGTPARRGLVHWAGDQSSQPRLLFGDGAWLIALDAASGQPIPSFGNGGKVAVPTGTTVAGAVFQEVFVIAGYDADVFGFDIRSGRELWRFKTRPTAGEYGSETWEGPGSGANCWGGIAMDESRGIAFVATGSPKPNFFGMGHKGDNLFSNCVIALDARSGKRLWHFQEVRHDIWDWDIPAPPNLVTVERHGRKVDAVAQVTKLGNTLLLDRVTGQPLYDFKLIKTEGKTLPGDVTSPYQPKPELPQPFARQAYTMDDAPKADPARTFVQPMLQRANMGLFPSIEEAKPTVMFNIHGGAEWTGAAADSRGFLYVTSNEIPWAITPFRDDDPEPLKPATSGEQLYQQMCAACHGPDRRGVGHAPPLRGVRHRVDEAAIRALLKTGRSTMPPMPSLTEEQLRPLLDFVLCRDRGDAAPIRKGDGAWTFAGFKKLLDAEGYPACTPPWGSLVCINLNTGKIAWSVPFGEYQELSAKGVPLTGQENFGGASVTASGVVFATGTRDGMIRAFAASTGKELWKHALPFTGTAAPSIYEAGGRQYVVVTATGGGKLATPAGDAWVAFALPGESKAP